MDEKENDKAGYNSEWLGVGIALGITYGLVFDNLAVGIVMGIAIGAGLSSTSWTGKKKDKEKNVS